MCQLLLGFLQVHFRPVDAVHEALEVGLFLRQEWIDLVSVARQKQHVVFAAMETRN